MFSRTFGIICCLVISIWSAPIPGGRSDIWDDPIPGGRSHQNVNIELTDDEIIEYLKIFGHGKENLSESLKSFQQFTGLTPTGLADERTLKQINTPRCQLPDHSTNNAAFKDKRSKRFATSGKWNTLRNLSYYFQSYPTNSLGLTNQSVETIFKAAVSYWSSVSPFTFSKVTNIFLSNVRILFASYNHGDSYPFDGKGLVIAHSFYPESGNTHYDNTLQWSDGVTLGLNLKQTFTHEMGHILGLAHSTVKTAVMYPYYNGYIANFALDPDDINGIQSLYGPPVTTTQATTKATTTKHV